MHFPVEDLRAVIDEVLRTEGARALDYGPAAGLPTLRQWLAERLTSRGIPTNAEQVLIVNGSQQGLDLVARTLLGSGDRVLVEEPSYSNGFRLFQTYGATIDGVPTDDRGLIPEALAVALAKAPCSLLYMMPIFQNPTGTVLAPERIDPILDLAAEHQLPILEDHFDADLVYEGDDPEPMKHRDSREQVILLGTFSKILFPGLRLGWLVLPRPLVERVVEVKQMADLSSGLLVQHAMDLYCRRGLLDLHIGRVRIANGARLAALRDSLEKEMPAGVRWTTPRGGMTVWLTLPPEVDSLALLQTARASGVDFSPGPLFFPNGGGGHHLRLCYVRETEERIRLGISRLASAIREEMARRREEPARPFV
jgi:2-aminoadipate transaminase